MMGIVKKLKRHRNGDNFAVKNNNKGLNTNSGSVAGHKTSNGREIPSKNNSSNKLTKPNKSNQAH